MARDNPLPTVYNLLWFIPPPQPVEAMVGRHDDNRLPVLDPIEAIILYPAFATPEVMVGDDDRLELLLLTKENRSQRFIKRRILKQLKITLGLDPKKPAFDSDLFPPNPDDNLSPFDFLNVGNALTLERDTRLETISQKFKGYIDERVFDRVTQQGFTTVYPVSIHPSCLEAAGGPSSNSDNAVAEDQDRLIVEQVFDVRHPKLKQDDGRYYAFETGAADVDCTSFDKNNPLQSWHPVYHYATLQYGNVSHIADIHLSARQQIIAESNARVIDYAPGNAAAGNDSPPIGSKINICSQALSDIFSKFNQSEQADLLVIGGDVVDFQQNCFLSQSISATLEGNDGKAGSVWDAVTVAGDINGKCDDTLDKSSFTNCIDFIIFYGILLRYCSHKPAYLVSGNHDCYWDPYGMSPRILARAPGDKWYQGSGTGAKRANEGIPADHNLTFYEAILAFGESYPLVKAPMVKSPPSPFRPDKFDWFYMVLTPFTDYSIELPNQKLVAFGWGDDESLFDCPFTGHGFGHLPQATEAVSPTQLALLEEAVGGPKKVILLTHFTFVSYQEPLAMTDGVTTPGDVYFDTFKKYDQHNLGTFADNRKVIFETHCYNNRDIQIILTGHSHRRGLYLINDIDYSGRNSVKTLQFDFDDFANQVQGNYPIEPAVIVSDSGGTIPRFNKAGEFSGWGSDQPAGTIVRFDQAAGAIDGITAVRAATCKPRIVVAVDYLDVYKDRDVITQFESETFDIAQEQNGQLNSLGFFVSLSDEVTECGLYVDRISFCTRDDRVVLQRGQAGSGIDFTINGADEIAVFEEIITQSEQRGCFMAIKFGKLDVLDPHGALSRYNFDDNWCVEFQIDFETFGKILLWAPKSKKYFIKRKKTRAEIPSFDWRRQFVPEKYV